MLLPASKANSTISVQSRIGHFGRRFGNSSQAATAHRISVPICTVALERDDCSSQVLRSAGDRLPMRTHHQTDAPGEGRGKKEKRAHEHPRATDPAVPHIYPHVRFMEILAGSLVGRA